MEITPDLIQVTPSLQVPEAAALAFSAKWQAAAANAGVAHLVHGDRYGAAQFRQFDIADGQLAAGSLGVVQVSERTDEGNLLVYRHARNTAVPKPPIPSSSHLCLAAFEFSIK